LIWTVDVDSHAYEDMLHDDAGNVAMFSSLASKTSRSSPWLRLNCTLGLITNCSD
jgi:hypothetical protein